MDGVPTADRQLTTTATAIAYPSALSSASKYCSMRYVSMGLCRIFVEIFRRRRSVDGDVLRAYYWNVQVV